MDFKKRYPERVFLLMGNRDINKLRFLAELSLRECLNDPEQAFFAFWEDFPKRYTQFLQEAKQEAFNCNLKNSRTDGLLSDDSHASVLTSRCLRLKFMLEHTLGCPNTFELRRQELRQMVFDSSETISDEQVVQSFVDEIRPEGVYGQYLIHSQLGLCLGNTLFVHGKLHESSAGFVPDDSTPYALHGPPIGREMLNEGASVHAWINELNAFAQRQVAAAFACPEFSTDRTRAGSALLCYQSSRGICKRTVCVESFIDNGAMAQLSEPMVNYLQGSGLARVVVGHKPAGVSPAILCQDSLGYKVQLLNCDLNYCDPEDQALGKGAAVCEVLIEGHAHCNQVFVHGKIPQGEEYAFYLPPLCSSNAASNPNINIVCNRCVNETKIQRGDFWVGHQLPDGFWVKAVLQTSQSEFKKYLCVKSSHRKQTYRISTASEVEASFLTSKASSPPEIYINQNPPNPNPDATSSLFRANI